MPTATQSGSASSRPTEKLQAGQSTSPAGTPQSAAPWLTNGEHGANGPTVADRDIEVPFPAMLSHFGTLGSGPFSTL